MSLSLSAGLVDLPGSAASEDSVLGKPPSASGQEWLGAEFGLPFCDSSASRRHGLGRRCCWG
eukprot:870385-Alexandrium_andersonii.AAC.1